MQQRLLVHLSRGSELSSPFPTTSERTFDSSDKSTPESRDNQIYDEERGGETPSGSGHGDSGHRSVSRSRRSQAEVSPDTVGSAITTSTTTNTDPPSLPPLSTSTDLLIAAILDGDVQGIRTVIRSRGSNLLSSYWRDASSSLLPLHRAVSGLHFHGNERQLIASLESLIQLGADVHLLDDDQNTVLQKALCVCTSKSVMTVVNTLIASGVSVSNRNRRGLQAIHMECQRFVRKGSASQVFFNFFDNTYLIYCLNYKI